MATTVVDELVTKITLDAREYEKADKAIDKRVTETERKQQKADKKRDERAKKRKRDAEAEKREEQERVKRTKQSEQAIKSLHGSLKSLALTMSTVFGVGGGAAGIIGAVLSLTSFETGLRRAAVSTGMSNRQMQAWGSTARRLGADADAGAAAIAALAREQKQFNLTGSGPTMQALARMGVNVGPNANIGEMLGQAQQIYRGASPAQRSQIEASLSAQGVSDDLIVMIKSETDAREAYTRSLSEATDENRKALSAVTDALEAVKNSGLALANTIAQSALPYIQQFADWMHNVASDQSGLDKTARNLADGMKFLYDAVNVIVYGFKQMGAGIEWILDKLPHVNVGGKATSLGSLFKDAIKWAWHDTVNEAEGKIAPGTGMLGGARAVLTPGARAASGAGTSGKSPGAVPAGDAQALMQKLVTGYGFTVPEAAALVANAQGESSLNPGAVNPHGGAAGLWQWLSKDRRAAFRASVGVDPQYASVDQQIGFLMSNPYELHLLRKSFAGGGSAAALGERFSRIYEAHGNVAEDLRRGQLAATLAAQYGGGTAASLSPGESIVNINGPVHVHANDPAGLVDGVKRIANPAQNYNSAVR